MTDGGLSSISSDPMDALVQNSISGGRHRFPLPTHDPKVEICPAVRQAKMKVKKVAVE